MTGKRRDDGGRMASVRRNYGVPAFRGAIVTYHGRPFRPITGRIISCDGNYLYLRDEATGRRIGPFHPTSEMDYGDGRDYSAEGDARIDVWNDRLNGRITHEEYVERLARLPIVLRNAKAAA